MFVIKEILFYGAHRILWALMKFPSLKFRQQILIICGANIGKASFMTDVRVIAPWKLTIGYGVTINSNVLLDCRGGLVIGDNVMVGYSTSIHSMGHKYSQASFPVFKRPVEIRSGTIIFSHCYLGPGIIVEKSCTLLPGTFMLRQLTKPYEVYEGNPCVLVRTLEAAVDRGGLYNSSPLGF